jgi:hypothetical protein
MEMSGQLHVPAALPPGKETKSCIIQEQKSMISNGALSVLNFPGLSPLPVFMFTINLND